MFIKKRKRTMSKQDQDRWFDELNEESQQDICIKYLRSLDKRSLNALYAAVDLYRQGDVALGRVKDPEAERKEQLMKEPEDTGDFIPTDQDE